MLNAIFQQGKLTISKINADTEEYLPNHQCDRVNYS